MTRPAAPAVATAPPEPPESALGHPGRPPAPRGTAPRRTWPGVVRSELLLQHRYRVPVAVAALSVAAGVLLGVAERLQPGTARLLTPYVLLVDTSTVGTSVVAALLLAGRSEGSLAATVTAPPGALGLLLVRTGVLTGLVTLTAVVVAFPALVTGPGPAGVPVLLLGTGLVALLLTAGSAAVAARSRSLNGYLVAVPVVLAPLLALPLAVGLGLLDRPWPGLVPTMTAFDLFRRASGGGSPGPTTGSVVLSVVLSAAVAAAAFAVAVRWLREGPPPERPRRHRARPVVGPGTAVRQHRPGGTADVVLGFARTDLRLVSRDAVLAVVLGSPVMLGAVLRWAYPPLEAWAATRHGVDLTPHRTTVLLALVVLHVPFTCGMVAGLLVLEDRDEGVLTALQVSPLPRAGYLDHRLGAAALLAAVGLAVAVPLSGLLPPTVRLLPMLGGLALAALLAPVFAVTLAVVAGSRVEGVLVVKALGLPLYLPLALVALPAPWAAAGTAVLGVLPSTWVVVAVRSALG